MNIIRYLKRLFKGPSLMGDTFAPKLIGTVTVYKECYGRWKLVAHKRNAIQAIAKEVVAERLAENDLVRVDQIEVINGGLSLAIRPITERLVAPAEPDAVTFNAIFEEAAFSGPFTECRLISSAKGNFSIITGLALTKSPTEKIMISWKIKIA